MSQSSSAEEQALLTLLSMAPLESVPTLHVPTLCRLAERGLAVAVADRWYPTRLGLEQIGCSLH